jgi:hypothetical protein
LEKIIVAQKKPPGKWPPPATGPAALDFPGDPLQNAPMKKQSNAANACLFFLTLSAWFVAAALPAAPGSDDVLAKLNLAPAAAKDGVLETLASGAAYNDSAYRAFRALPGLARETIVRAGMAWIKSYVAGAEFKASYDALRERERPEPPAARLSADDEFKKMKADMEKSIAGTRQNMAAMDAETRKALEAGIQQMRAQLEQMEKDPQQRDIMRQSVEMGRADDKKRHEDALQEWQQRYPADYRALIKRRIGEFLAASNGVDYTAKLTPRGDKMIFANEAYEQKPPEWKLCYRAGKEATEAARTLAKAWLAELEKN